MQSLLIIDVQNDYFPGGRQELVGANEALTNVRSALTEFRRRRLPIIHVQHINTRPGATFFLPDTEGVLIHADVTPAEGEDLIVKHAPNSFHQTYLADLIQERGIDGLVVCGMMTQMCVDTTVRAAKDYGIPVTLLHDACATKDLTFNGATVPAAQVQTAYMAALSGLFATVIATADLTVVSPNK
jgi:nicotinamidase-related amidase